MKHFIAMIKREYWEWRKVIFWTIGVFSFLLLLTLIPLNRLSNEIESWTNRSHTQHDIDQLKLDDLVLSELDEKELSNLLKEMGFKDTKSILDRQDQTIREALAENSMIVIKPYGIWILTGFTMIQLFVLFISLFYFSDSLYKERTNDSTYYFRSLPVSDHWLLFSKLKAGGIGVIGLTIVMLLILLGYSHLAVMTVSWNIWSILSESISQINILDLFTDLVIYQAVSIIWFSPMILFLMLVSSAVKNRPLIIGIGLPILASITLTVLFGENALVNQIGDVFGAIGKMVTEQTLITEITTASVNGVDILGSFWKYLFSFRTSGSLLVSGLLYITTWNMYRKNISTN